MGKAINTFAAAQFCIVLDCIVFVMFLTSVLVKYTSFIFMTPILSRSERVNNKCFVCYFSKYILHKPIKPDILINLNGQIYKYIYICIIHLIQNF